MQYGLSEHKWAQIVAVVAADPAVETLILYGSRAKGNDIPGSDIDLIIKGADVTWNEILRLDNELDDLLLPEQIDLASYHDIANPGLIAHIDRVGKVLYSAPHIANTTST